MYFDSHAHYDSGAFDRDRDSLLRALPGSGVDGLINCGCDLESSLASVRLAERYPYVWAAVGTHPEDADSFSETVLERYRTLLKHPRVAAVGEIGLDYHYEDAPSREQQLFAFRRQMDLAAETGMPVIVHVRDAMGDAMEVAREYAGKVTGVFHCFAGSVETARELLKMGWYLGFTGVLTFKNGRKAAQVVEYAPLSRLLLETDCPYMAPEPFRGRRCDSRMLEMTCRKMAQIKEVTPEACAAATQENVRRLFFRTADTPKKTGDEA